MCNQVARKLGFGKDQKEDNQLKHCWGLVLHIDGENTHPNQEVPTPYFLVQNGLLYFQCNRCGEPCDHLVMPHTKIDTVIYLARWLSTCLVATWDS